MPGFLEKIGCSVAQTRPTTLAAAQEKVLPRHVANSYQHICLYEDSKHCSAPSPYRTPIICQVCNHQHMPNVPERALTKDLAELENIQQDLRVHLKYLLNRKTNSKKFIKEYEAEHGKVLDAMEADDLLLLQKVLLEQH